MYSVVLIIDADEARAQRVARILALTDYRPMVTNSPYQALDRLVQERVMPSAILVGQTQLPPHHMLFRQLQQIVHGKNVPFISLPSTISEDIPIYAAAARSPGAHLLSQECLKFLAYIWQRAPALSKLITPLPATDSRILQSLPAIGLQPRVTAHHRSRNSHFLLMLSSAVLILGAHVWPQLARDVGLELYADRSKWPPHNDDLAIPPEHLSLLHQALAFSLPQKPAAQIVRWSKETTEALLKSQTRLSVSQHLLRFLPDEKVVTTLLNNFTALFNGVRGEELHAWVEIDEREYWLVHYSNLYSYGRASSMTSSCYMWITALQSLLHVLKLDGSWEVRELECSCHTLTGHCLFALHPKFAY